LSPGFWANTPIADNPAQTEETCMKKFAAVVMVYSLAVISSLAQDEAAESATPFDNLADRASYAIGFQMGSGMKMQGIEVNPDLVHRGLKDGLEGSKPAMTTEQVQETLMDFQQSQQQAMAERRQKQSEENVVEGRKFLEANKEKEGVKVMASGLQYEILKEGDGEKPSATDTVLAHYTGTLIDGTVFDSSVERGRPSEFPVNRVIRGWTEALQQMPVGSKWRLYIPSDLAYGERGAPPMIGPNAVLIFDVELLEIKSAEPTAEGELEAAPEVTPAE